MKVFVTGATGFVGSAVVQELLAGGHQVLGLARSEESAGKLTEAGAEVHRGDLTDFESLKTGASVADAVVHLGFVHDFTRFEEMCELDRKVIESIGEVLMGTDKPFLITSGTALFSKEGITNENDRSFTSPYPRMATEDAADDIAAKGVKVAVIRLPPSVHGKGDMIGFVPILIRLAKEKGISAVIQGGDNVWPAVHKLDAAKLYRLALEKPFVGGTRYHANAEQGIPFKNIAGAIAEQLKVPVVSLTPEEAVQHFAWFEHFAHLNNHTSSEQTRQYLGWEPQHATLLEELKSPVYFPEQS